MLPKQKTYLKLFLLIAVAYLISLFIGPAYLSSFLKPLLLIPLMGAASASTFPFKKLLLAALVFCWIGDVVLLFADRDALFFISGLVSFLIGHVFYILLFLKMKENNGRFKGWNPVVLLVILAYLIIFYYRMNPHLGSMLVPVMIYAVIISSMLYCAWLVYSASPQSSHIFILMGALTFVISDSVLAVNKFYTPLPLSGFLIMVTYISAQGAIVYGCLKNEYLK